MAFGVRTNQKSTGRSFVRGIQKKVACESWFTSTGKAMPLMVKVEDENGEIRTIREIMVHSYEKKMYAGVPSIEYDCTLTVENRRIRVWLIYYPTENQWVLNFR